MIHKELKKSFKKPKKQMDDDEIAEIIAIGKKMLRKHDREEIIDQSYNRWNYQDDNEDLPQWFVEDE
jgi:AdoMet-dependent rRNA methyltransferase SPB1